MSETTARTALLALVAVLAACSESPIPASGPDQCMRAELFARCLTALPAGPQATKYNDWSEVVESCERSAYYQSLREKASIKPECRA